MVDVFWSKVDIFLFDYGIHLSGLILFIFINIYV